MGKILITGITGNVGRFVYEALEELGQEVVGAVTSIAKSKERFKGIKLVEFDFRNTSSYEGALTGVDRVFLIRPPHLGKPQDLYPFIDAMKKKHIKLVSFLSLMGVENNPIPPHHKIEKYIELAGLPYCHIRPGFFMQNLSGIHADEIRLDNKIFIPAGNSKCSFIDTKDIGIAIAKILCEYEKHQNKAYTITGGEALDYYQIAHLLSQVLGREVTYAKPSWLSFRRHMLKNRKIDKQMVNVMTMLYFMTRLGTASAVHPDFETITGNKPRSFKDFAIDNLDVWIKI